MIVKGLDPGGLAVSVLRSCYSTKARLFQGDPTETDITWYFVPEDRPFLPFPTFLDSRNWDDERTDWPQGKDKPPGGDGTELGEVLGAARPWRNGSDPIHYPGTHPLGTAEQFANGLTDPPLVYENVCDLLNPSVDLSATWRWVFFNDFFVDDGEPMVGAFLCEGLEAVVRCVFQGRIIKDTFKMGLIDVATGPIGNHTVYADIVQPTDPAYHLVAVPAAQLNVREYNIPVECYWYADADVRYFDFTAEAYIRGAFLTCELQPGVPRLLAYGATNPPIHVPDTGGHLGISIEGLIFLSPDNP